MNAIQVCRAWTRLVRRLAFIICSILNSGQSVSVVSTFADRSPGALGSFLHAWVVTRYQDVVRVLHGFSADRTPSPEQLERMNLSAISPIAAEHGKQMLFLDAPAHTRLRSLASSAFTPARVRVLRSHIQQIADTLIDAAMAAQPGQMDIIAEFAEPLPAIVTAEMLGVPIRDHRQLKDWTAVFAEMLGNFQHNPDHVPKVLRALEEMLEYFRETRSRIASAST